MKTVLITGAAGGLGQELAREFLNEGWKVLSAYHRQKPTLGVPILLDVTNSTAVAVAFARIDSLDLLINNAGINHNALLSETTDEDWQRVIDVSLKGAFLCSRAAAPLLKETQGHIINISSFAARSGPRGQSAYAATKAGLLALSQTLAAELAPEIRVNAILPGVLPTAMIANLNSDQLTAFARANLLNRLNDLDEVARFIRFLATTKNISAQSFQLDSRLAPVGLADALTTGLCHCYREAELDRP